jgi:hypothetical protein
MKIDSLALPFLEKRGRQSRGIVDAELLRGQDREPRKTSHVELVIRRAGERQISVVQWLQLLGRIQLPSKSSGGVSIQPRVRFEYFARVPVGVYEHPGLGAHTLPPGNYLTRARLFRRAPPGNRRF